MSDHQPPSVVLPAVSVVLVLVAYVVAYSAAVRPYFPRGGAGFPLVIPVYDSPIGPKRRDQWLGIAFAPAHWLDRRIRPELWEPAKP